MWQEEREEMWREMRRRIGEEARRVVDGGDGRWCAPEHERDREGMEEGEIGLKVRVWGGGVEE